MGQHQISDWDYFELTRDRDWLAAHWVLVGVDTIIPAANMIVNY